MQETPLHEGNGARNSVRHTDYSQGGFNLNYTRSNSKTDAYKQAGWDVLTPLPAGQKFPPMPGITGNIAYEQRLKSVSTAWEEVDENSNLGLVLATDDEEVFDIIVLDVDDYKGKNGREHLEELEDELGSLDLHNVVRSNRRGVDDRGGHFFFKVAKGKAWANSACEGVDILQSAHRYAVAHPSVVDGLEYRWYLGNVDAEIPKVDDLPWLPQPWQDHLLNGEAKEAAHKANVADFDTAVDWLEDRCLPGEAEKVELNGEEGNRHDTMHGLVSRLVSNAVFVGRPGVIASLKAAQRGYKEVLESTDDYKADRRKEFKKSVVDAVAYAKGQVEIGEAEDVNWRELDERVGGIANCAMPDLAEWLGLNAADTETTGAEATSEEEPNPSVHGLIDLSAILNGTYEPLQPKVGQLSDGTALLYPGEIHDIHGYSGSGKSWVGLALAAQEIKAGNGVLWVDYEQSPAIVVGRLRDLGLTVEEISERFGYMRPESFPFTGTAAEKEYRAVLEANPFSLVVLDGVNQSFSLAGYDTHSTDDANAWHRLVPLKAAKIGAAVVQIDHTVKNKEGDVTHAFGAQGKRANVAVSIGAVATRQALRPGYQGTLELVVYKDRHGKLLARSQPYKNGHHLATFVIEPDNSFRFEPENEMTYSPFTVETKPGVLDGHPGLPANDPRHTAKIGALNGAIATVLCKRNRVDTVTRNEMKNCWQELAPIRWKEEQDKITKCLTKTRHTGLADVSTRADRLRFRPLAEGDSGTSSEALAAAKTLANFVLNSEG